MDNIVELRERKLRLITEGRALLDKARSEKRSQTAEESNQYDKIFSDIVGIDKQIAREEQQRSLDKMNAEMATAAEAEARAKPTSKEDEARSAMTKFLISGHKGLTDSELRSLQASNDTLGGYLTVPQVMASGFIKALDSNVFMRSMATKYSVAASQSLGIVTLDADPSDPIWTSELSTGDEDSSMRFGKRELRPHALAKRIKISKQLMRSQGQNAEAIAMGRLAYKFGIAEENAFLTGNGVEKPLGIFTASADGISTARDVSTGSATSITLDGLYDTYYALREQYRRNAKWLLSTAAIKIIMKLKTTTNEPIFQPSLQLGQPASLLGLPILESELVPSTFTTGLYVGMLADFSFYHIADSLDMQVQVLNELYALTNQVGIIMRRETDGMPVLEEAFARMKTA